MKEEKKTKFIPYSRFFLAWLAFFFIMHFTQLGYWIHKFYFGIFVVYIVVSEFWYSGNLRKYLVENCREACDDLMLKMHGVFVPRYEGYKAYDVRSVWFMALNNTFLADDETLYLLRREFWLRILFLFGSFFLWFFTALRY